MLVEQQSEAHPVEQAEVRSEQYTEGLAEHLPGTVQVGFSGHPQLTDGAQLDYQLARW